MNKIAPTSALLSIVGIAAIAAPKSPNVLIIHTDEQSFRTIGAHRALLPQEAAEPWGKGNNVETPNLDYLANNGVLCSNFYAASPVSSPSRSTFVSGMYMGDTHVIANDVHMNDNIVTFAQTLLNNGYATGYAGKWHLDGDEKPGWAPKAKFGFDDNTYMFNRGHDKVVLEEAGVPKMGVNAKGQSLYGKLGTEKTFMTDFLADRAVNFIKENKGKPFCYMISIPDPHDPNSVRPPYDGLYHDLTYETPASANVNQNNIPQWLKKQGNKRPKGLTLPQEPKMMASYLGMVKCIDDNVGKLINFLKEEGLFEDTIIVFSADHGDMLGEHDKDNKGIPFEGSAKIPFIIHYPKGLKGGSVVHYPMNTADFTPTILAMTGVKSDIKYAGRDCSNMIRTNKIEKGWNNVAFSSMGSWMMATDGRYKLIRSVRASGYIEENEPVLFDLIEDPMEVNNIYGQSGLEAVTKTLQAHLDRYYTTDWATNSGRDKQVVWAESNTRNR